MADPDGMPARRVSDAERARAASEVDAAVADGRLTWTEHAERTGLIWAARTRDELLPPIADLGPVALEPSRSQQVNVFCSKVIRAVAAGTGQVGARARFGAIVLNLAALRPGEAIDVAASSFCGKVMIIVPDDATVIDEGDVILGKRATPRGPADPGGPVIRLTGRSTLGNLKVFRSGDRVV
jgi:hypothetical protein